MEKSLCISSDKKKNIRYNYINIALCAVHTQKNSNKNRKKQTIWVNQDEAKNTTLENKLHNGYEMEWIASTLRAHSEETDERWATNIIQTRLIAENQKLKVKESNSRAYQTHKQINGTLKLGTWQDIGNSLEY